MKPNRRHMSLLATGVTLAIAGGFALAQPGMRRGWGGNNGVIPEDRAGIPNWSVDEKFKKDVFTFCRVQYDSVPRPAPEGGGFGRGAAGRRGGGRGFSRGGWGRGPGWLTDFPDSDLNFSFRLQQLTSFRVNPEPINRRLTAPDLADYPFLYMIEPGWLLFSDEEVKALRHYLLNGGFLMVDDFWGDQEWAMFYEQIKRVFPDREAQDLDIGHDIFRTVYKLKELPQVPSIRAMEFARENGVTYEPGHGGNTEQVHYRAFFDDKGRMMVIICHNTDLGDGWEEEGVDPWYFQEFASKRAYPMGINIVTYAMTH